MCWVVQVFVGGKTIGGGDDTKALSDSGKLKGMLKEVRAL
jgi:glutaredoxin-related protein